MKEKKRQEFLKSLFTSKRIQIHSPQNTIMENSGYCVRCGNKVEIMDNKYFGVCEDCGCRKYFIKLSSWQQLANQQQGITQFIFYSPVGTGDTTANTFRVWKKMIEVPAYWILVMAGSESQLDETAKKELDKFFLDSDFEIKNQKKWVLKNGSTVSWSSAKSDSLLKGRSLSGVWLLEAHGIDKSIYEELVNRIRNKATNEYEKDSDGNFIKVQKGNKTQRVLKKDNSLLLVESNIRYGWPYEIACSAKKIYMSPSFKYQNYDFVDRKNTKDEWVCFMCSTKDSSFYDEKQYRKLIQNKSKQEIEREIYGDITAMGEEIIIGWEKQVEELNPRVLQLHGFRRVIFAYDFGGAVGYSTCMPIIIYNRNGGKNPENLSIHICKSYYEKANDIDTNIRNIKEFREKFFNGTWTPNSNHQAYSIPLDGDCGDKSGQRKNIQTMKTTFELYRKVGINLKPSSDPANSSLPTINTLIRDKNLTIDPQATNLINELKKFQYKKNDAGQLLIPDDTHSRRRDAIDSLCYGIEFFNYQLENYKPSSYQKSAKIYCKGKLIYA